jgi:hypothetical protein
MHGVQVRDLLLKGLVGASAIRALYQNKGRNTRGSCHRYEGL